MDGRVSKYSLTQGQGSLDEMALVYQCIMSFEARKGRMNKANMRLFEFLNRGEDINNSRTISKPCRSWSRSWRCSPQSEAEEEEASRLGFRPSLRGTQEI